jgi:hypothetical protein
MNRLRIAKFAVAAIAVLGPVAYGISQIGSAETALERTLREIGFYPLRPPSTLVGPGSIYHVSRNGKFYTTICRAEKEDIGPALSRSPSEEMVARELQTVAYALDGNLAKLINAKLGHDVVESVSYSLRDVAVLEIPLDKNGEIAARLTGRESCRNAVRDLLESGELVCQGQSVLLATMQYELTEKSALGTDAKLTDEHAPVVREAIEAVSNASVAVDQGRFVSGTELYYGVKMNPVCMALKDDSEGRFLPKPAEAATRAASMPLISGT